MSGEPGDDPCCEGAREPRVFDTDLIQDLLRIVGRGKNVETLPMGRGENVETLPMGQGT